MDSFEVILFLLCTNGKSTIKLPCFWDIICLFVFHSFCPSISSKIPSDSSPYGLLAWILSEIFSSFSNVKPCGSVVVDAPFFTLIFGLFFHYRKPWCFFSPARDELMKQKISKTKTKDTCASAKSYSSTSSAKKGSVDLEFCFCSSDFTLEIYPPPIFVGGSLLCLSNYHDFNLLESPASLSIPLGSSDTEKPPPTSAVHPGLIVKIVGGSWKPQWFLGVGFLFASPKNYQPILHLNNRFF